MKAVVTDTTVLSNFARIGRLDLLYEAYPTAGAPPAVWQEIDRGLLLSRIPDSDWTPLIRLKLSVEEGAIASKLQTMLGAGESECIAVAQGRGWTLLTDDLAARTNAKQRFLKVSGTVGVLIALHSDRKVTVFEADRLLQQMMAAGYRSPVDTLRDLLE